MASLEVQTRDFVFLVRESFVNQPEKFDVFTIILRDLTTRNYVDLPLQISKLKTLCSDDQDLLLRLNYYLPQPYKIKTPIQIVRKDTVKIPMKKLLEIHRKKLNSPSEFVSNILKRCSKTENYGMLTDFMEIMVSYKRKKVNAEEVDAEFRRIFDKHPDLLEESNHFSANSLKFRKSREWDGKVVKQFTKYESSMFKKEDCLYEMDLANEPLKVTAQKLETNPRDGKVVKQFTKYENSMFKKEDCLYEMDLAIERLKVTAQKLETNPEEFVTYYNNLDFKCIKELYAGPSRDYEDVGRQIMEILCRYPVDTSKVLVQRMNQKMEELKKQKKPRLEETWEEIFENVRQSRGVRHCEFLMDEKRGYEEGDR